MNAAPGSAALDEPRIESARIAAAHDGSAELVLALRHPNGGLGEVTLDADAAGRLFDACNVSRAEELTGFGWRAVRDALTGAWNRFQT